jgi:AcrR family transcriptional regulator
MKLYAAGSLEELVRYYKTKQNPDEKISANQACTIATIIDAFFALLSKKNASLDKITVKELVMKAGYSRTTFYVHFYDVYSVMNMLEDLLLYHMELNARAYYLIFLDQLSPDAVKEMYGMLNYYGKYVKLILSRDNSFMSRYKDMFMSLITQNFEGKELEDCKKLCCSRICAAAMIEGYIFWLEHQDTLSHEVVVKAVSKIMSSVICNEDKENKE